MIDLLLLLVGAVLILCGLWLVYPPLMLVVLGVAVLWVAYGRYQNDKQAQTGPNRRNQPGTGMI